MKREAHARDPRCHWCKRVTILKAFQRAGPDEASLIATEDHIRCRAECSTRAEWDAPENRVLACHECNQRRGAEWVLANPGKRAAFSRARRGNAKIFKPQIAGSFAHSPRDLVGAVKRVAVVPPKQNLPRPPTIDQIEAFNTRVAKRVWELAAEGDARENLYEIVSREMMGLECTVRPGVGHTHY